MGAIDNIPANKQIGDKFLNTEYDAIVAGIKENREAIATAASGFQGNIAPYHNFVPSQMPKGYYNPTVLGADYGPTGDKYLHVPENPNEEGDSYNFQVVNDGATISLVKTPIQINLGEYQKQSLLSLHSSWAYNWISAASGGNYTYNDEGYLTGGEIRWADGVFGAIDNVVVTGGKYMSIRLNRPISEGNRYITLRFEYIGDNLSRVRTEGTGY